ncbi:MAG: cytochrome c biogenesis protein ResB [Tannerella sp.]|jgi:hypothetical protein|nr:cytochrome c biogenesis protein ResB [Tannerella sp.]
MKQSTREMWQYPWRYKESIAFVSGIIFVGIVLQFATGSFDFSIIQSPVNIILGVCMIVLLSLFFLLRNHPFYKWFSGVPFSVTLIATLLILGVVMGLTPQKAGHVHGERTFFSLLGFDRMTSSWPFVLIYFFILLSLGALILRRLIPFRKKDYAFYLNHIGLWILLFAAGLGSSDIRRYVMHIREGETEWRVYSEQKDVLELPIAIELNDFYMEEYPPKLAIINRNTGQVQPEETPDYFQIDTERPEGELAGWEVRLETYIHEAIRNSDSTYHEVHMPGASPAAYVYAQNKATGESTAGWICGGNISQLYMVLNLDSTYCVVMTQPEPKRFVSDIHIMTENRQEAHALLEVNKPYRMGNWMLYQYGYDNEAGKLSTYSSIELVYDPWVTPVYIGICMLAAGSVCMLWSGNRRREGVNNDVG